MIMNTTLKMQTSYEIKYKEKISSNLKAIMFLRYSDNCQFIPIVRIYNLDNKLILEQECHEINSLDSLGSLVVTKNKLTIKAKKNNCENLKDNCIIIT